MMHEYDTYIGYDTYTSIMKIIRYDMIRDVCILKIVYINSEKYNKYIIVNVWIQIKIICIKVVNTKNNKLLSL